MIAYIFIFLLLLAAEMVYFCIRGEGWGVYVAMRIKKLKN